MDKNFTRGVVKTGDHFHNLDPHMICIPEGSSPPSIVIEAGTGEISDSYFRPDNTSYSLMAGSLGEQPQPAKHRMVSLGKYGLIYSLEAQELPEGPRNQPNRRAMRLAKAAGYADLVIRDQAYLVNRECMPDITCSSRTPEFLFKRVMGDEERKVERVRNPRYDDRRNDMAALEEFFDLSAWDVSRAYDDSNKWHEEFRLSVKRAREDLKDDAVGKKARVEGDVVEVA